jgi:hypothetical protein
MQPVGLAMVVCDAVWRDPATGKHTLLGTFSALFARQFPLRWPMMAVYCAVTECRGKVPVSIRIIDTNEERDPVAVSPGEIDLDDPLGVVEMVHMLGNLVFPEPGEYRVQLFADETLIVERRLVVTHPPAPPREGEEQ